MTTLERIAGIERSLAASRDNGLWLPDSEWLCSELRKALARVAELEARIPDDPCHDEL